MRASSRLVVASYNVHSCVGIDGRRDPSRVAAVISELEADIVGVQEVGSSGTSLARGLDQLAWIASASGYAFVPGPTLLRRDDHYGNGLLTRLAVRNTRLIDLSLPGREPRGAIDVELAHEGSRIRVVATHLGLFPSERRKQCDRLLDCLEPEGGFDVALLLGDFNEWWPSSAQLRRLHHFFGRTRSARSFPSPAPVLNLDRIWVKPAGALREFRAHRSPLSRRASDHLPVRAVIELPMASVDGDELGERGASDDA